MTEIKYGLPEEITGRAIFEKVKVHLLSQMERCLGTTGLNCSYRGAGGMACAVGCLMSEEIVPKKGRYLSASVGTVLHGWKGRKDCRGRWARELLPYQYLLWHLQCIHDSLLPSMWEDNLTRLEQHPEIFEPGWNGTVSPILWAQKTHE